MTNVHIFLPYIQILLAVMIIGGVLLQQSDTSLGSTFGGSESSRNFHTRRGMENVIFIGTIIVSVLFVGTCFIALLV